MISRRVQVIVTVVAFVAIPVLAVLLIIGPLNRQARADEASRASLAAVNRSQAARNGELQNDRAQLAVLQDEKADLDAAVPSKPGIETLIADLGTIGTQQGVEIVSFTNSGSSGSPTPGAATSPAASPASSPAPSATPSGAAVGPGSVAPARPTGVEEYAIEVEATGPLARLRNFVGAVQRATRIIDVTGVTISGDADGGYSVHITGSAFAIPSPTASVPSTASASSTASPSASSTASAAPAAG